jgi:hypothetical protein
MDEPAPHSRGQNRATSSRQLIVGAIKCRAPTRDSLLDHHDQRAERTAIRTHAAQRFAMPFDAIFQPITFRNLTIKNRIFRSNISGRFDNYDGSGNRARINWETKFAKGGVGAIVSSFVPVHLRGRIVPNYAMIDHDRHIPFWREVGRRCTSTTAGS